MSVARELLVDHKHEDTLTLRHWRGGWMRWHQRCWTEDEERAIRAWLYETLDGVGYWHVDPKTKAEEIRPWRPNRRKIADVLDALAAITHLSESIDPPAWLEQSPVPAGEVVACTNGLLHVGTRKLHPLTPLYFNRVAVPFDWDPAAPIPARWLKFLNQLWPDDPDSIAALQQFFGYVLSGRTDLHKILLIIGPTRAGKGVIARVLTALLGKGNVAGPTLASLGTNFGLAPLLGKPLAVVSDARLGGQNVHQVVERLLSISGEDILTVDRKYRDPWTGKLPSRFFILSNELPRFGDTSGAIAHRFIVLPLANSWLGKEDPKLTGRLLEELAGILAWSLDGLDQLTKPSSSSDSILALQDLVSPVAAFVRDHCTTGAELEVLVSELYSKWKIWCEDNGRDKPGTVQTFGRDLRAVVPRLHVHRGWDGNIRLPRRYVGVTLQKSDPQ
jgi:putative DNA primase/helicase